MKRTPFSRVGFLCLAAACLMTVAPGFAWCDGVPTPQQITGGQPVPCPAYTAAERETMYAPDYVGEDVPEYRGETDNGVEVMADTIIGRAGGLASIGIGIAGFVASLPFAVTSGSVGETADELLVKPFEFTFTRPVGEF